MNWHNNIIFKQVKGHLELKDQRFELKDVKDQETKVLNQMKDKNKERHLVVQLYNKYKFENGIKNLVRKCDRLIMSQDVIAQSNGDVKKIKNLTIDLESIIWAQKYIELPVISELIQVLTQFYGLNYIQVAQSAINIEQELKDAFSFTEPNQQQINDTFVKFSKSQNFSIEKINQAGHNVTTEEQIAQQQYQYQMYLQYQQQQQILQQQYWEQQRLIQQQQIVEQQRQEQQRLIQYQQSQEQLRIQEEQLRVQQEQLEKQKQVQQQEEEQQKKLQEQKLKQQKIREQIMEQQRIEQQRLEQQKVDEQKKLAEKQNTLDIKYQTLQQDLQENYKKASNYGQNDQFTQNSQFASFYDNTNQNTQQQFYNPGNPFDASSYQKDQKKLSNELDNYLSTQDKFFQNQQLQNPPQFNNPINLNQNNLQQNLNQNNLQQNLNENNLQQNLNQNNLQQNLNENNLQQNFTWSSLVDNNQNNQPMQTNKGVIDQKQFESYYNTYENGISKNTQQNDNDGQLSVGDLNFRLQKLKEAGV